MTVWPRAGLRSLAFVCGLLSLIAAVGIGCDSPERANGAPQQPTLFSMDWRQEMNVQRVRTAYVLLSFCQLCGQERHDGVD